MRTNKLQSNRGLSVLKASAGALAIASLLAVGGVKSFADDSYNMAPPIDYTNAVSTDTSNVFNWNEIPADQQVPLTRAVFDKSGYQLFDTAGETILIPFADNNLYVMKFAVSADGTTYFENVDGTPVLYLPRDGYLVNQASDGARWYPFTDGFAPATPVFLGVARSWDDYCGMGWYPGMVFYGGYFCSTPHYHFDALVPCDGFLISIGFENFNRWDDYRDYDRNRGDGCHIDYDQGDFHGWNGHHDDGVTFRGFGGGRGWDGQDNGGNYGGRVFRGAGGVGFSIRSGDNGRDGWNNDGGQNSWNNHDSSHDQGSDWNQGSNNGGHQFHGGDNGNSGDQRSWDNHVNRSNITNSPDWHQDGNLPRYTSQSPDNGRDWNGSTDRNVSSGSNDSNSSRNWNGSTDRNVPGGSNNSNGARNWNGSTDRNVQNWNNGGDFHSNQPSQGNNGHKSDTHDMTRDSRPNFTGWHGGFSNR